MENLDNQQLHKIFTKKKSFYRDMENISRKYLEFQQQVYYLPIKDINPAMIIKLEGINDLKNNHIKKREDIYIINGQYQPTGNKSFEKLILQLVQTIPRPTSAFGIIYINTLADSEAYNDFKKVLELLPIQYLINLTKIYVLEASFFNKAFSWLSFGVSISYINKKTINVDDLRELSQESHVQMDILKQKLPKNVVNALIRQQSPAQHPRAPKHRGLCVPEYEKVDKPKNTKHDNISTHFVVGNLGRTKSADNEFPQSNKPPQAKGKQISEYELGPTGAPVFLELLIYFFNNKEEYLKYEGLFRKSVSIQDETQILEELDKKNYNYLEKISDPHIIANAIKRFLCNLRNPIIPYPIFEEFMTKDYEPHYKNIVIQKIKQLPKTNKMIIFLLFDFLIKKVVPHAEWSKMGVNNLCIVFGPCLMKSQISSIKDLIYAKKIIVVTNIIFEQFETIFGDKNTQMKLKRNSYKQYRISQIKQRQSRESNKQSKQSSLQIKEQSPELLKEPIKQAHQDQPRTPTFRTATLLNRTSLFIKEALQKEESDDEFEDIQAEEPIPLIEFEENVDLSSKEQKKEENKISPINLFITPVVKQEVPKSKQELHHRNKYRRQYLEVEPKGKNEEQSAKINK